MRDWPKDSDDVEGLARLVRVIGEWDEREVRMQERDWPKDRDDVEVLARFVRVIAEWDEREVRMEERDRELNGDEDVVGVGGEETKNEMKDDVGVNQGESREPEGAREADEGDGICVPNLVVCLLALFCIAADCLLVCRC